MPANKTVQMSADEELDALAKEISRQTGKPYTLALREAGNRRQDLADARRSEIGVAAEEPAAAAAPVVHNLRVLPGETFPQVVTRIANEKQINLRAATQLASDAFPALAEKYASGETV